MRQERSEKSPKPPAVKGDFIVIFLAGKNKTGTELGSKQLPSSLQSTMHLPSGSGYGQGWRAEPGERPRGCLTLLLLPWQ